MVDLVISGIEKRFGRRKVLADINLTVTSEHLLAILGPSGGGKTTLLRLIAGFEHCDLGSIHIGTTTVAASGQHVPPERRRIGYVAQDGALFPHLSAGANIAFGLPRRERHNVSRQVELLELVGLPSGYRGRLPHELSGGEQQRVALARALAPEPQLILLDEPFSALDAGLRVETRRCVIAALQQTRATAVLVTHDQAEALSVGDQVAVLLDGRVAQVASPQDLYNRPRTAAIARFMGESNLVSSKVQGSSAICVLGCLGLDNTVPDGPAEILIRPEQIRIHPSDTAGLQRAQVVATDYYGHGESITLKTENEVLTARISGSSGISPGDLICFCIEGPVRAFPKADAERNGHSKNVTCNCESIA